MVTQEEQEDRYTGVREDMDTGLAQDGRAVWTKESEGGRQDYGTHCSCSVYVGMGTQQEWAVPGLLSLAKQLGVSSLSMVWTECSQTCSEAGGLDDR